MKDITEAQRKKYIDRAIEAGISALQNLEEADIHDIKVDLSTHEDGSKSISIKVDYEDEHSKLIADQFLKKVRERRCFEVVDR
jgi:YbbR domain-containing protein